MIHLVLLDSMDVQVAIYRMLVYTVKVEIINGNKDVVLSWFTSIVAYCKIETTKFSRGTYKWSETSAEDMTEHACQFGPVNNNVEGYVRRYCNPYGIWEEANITECLTEAQRTLMDIQNVCLL